MTCQLCLAPTYLWQTGLFDDRHGYPGFFEVYKCLGCGLGITIPGLKPSHIAKVYQKYYPWHKVNLAKIKLADFPPIDLEKSWRKGLGIDAHRLAKPGSTVLDVGCGVGYSLLELKNSGCLAYGIDPEPTGQKLAKKFGVNFFKGFITDKPFSGKKFDYITASQVLEHTPDPLKFVLACKKRLTPNGCLVLSFPNLNSLSRLILNKKWLHWHIPYHYWYFTKKSIELLAYRAGMQIVDIKSVTPNMWTNLQMRHLLFKHKPGVRDTFWDGEGQNTQTTFLTKLLTKVWAILEDNNFINRLIDEFDLGDAWVVTLSNP